MMADISEPLPQKVPDTTSTKSVLFGQLLQLRKWQEEQVQQLRSMQQQQWLQLQEEQERVGKLLNQHKGNRKNACLERTSYNDTRKQPEMETIKSNPQSKETHLNNRPHLSDYEENEISESSMQSLSDDLHTDKLDKEENEKNEDDISINPGIAGNMQSFEDLIEQQMLKQAESCNEKADHGNTNKDKQKRPFLRKGSGLSRFMSKPISYPKPKPLASIKHETSSQKIKNKPQYLQKSLKLKSACKKDATGDKNIVKNVHFNNGLDPRTSTHQFSDIEKGDRTNLNQKVQMYPIHVGSRIKASCQNFPDFANDNANNVNEFEPEFDDSLTRKEDLEARKLKEEEELVEFEMLEKVAQNCSFSSDSSVVQNVLQRRLLQPSDMRIGELVSYPESAKKYKEELPSSSEIYKNGISQTTDIHKILEVVKSRKQLLEQKIIDIEQPKLISLEKEDGLSEIPNSNIGILSANTISETEVISISSSDDNETDLSGIDDLDNLSAPNIDSECHPLLSDDDTSGKSGRLNSSESSLCDSDLGDEVVVDSNQQPVSPEVIERHPEVSLPYKYAEDNTQLEKQNGGNGVHRFSSETGDNTLASDRLKLKEKLKELEDEIEIFKTQNAELKYLQKQREEVLQKLQKEREEFQKFSQAEKKKFELETAEERKQFRRQKQTFERYQRLKKDLPGKKEREEFSILRQQVEKLQENLKKQEIKWTSECRRLRNQLSNVEKERDHFKIENQRLEVQRLDLLAALKERQKKSELDVPKSSLKSQDSSHSAKVQPVMKPSCKISKTFDNKSSTKIFNKQVEKKAIVSSNANALLKYSSADSLDTEEESITGGNADKEDPAGSGLLVHKHRVHFNLEPLVHGDSATEEDADFQEIQHKDKVERIYKTGEKEIIFPSGTRKVISSDVRNTTFYFYNGDVKEILPDHRVVYKYAESGTIQTNYPDGLEVVEFSNGQVERTYPDGMKQITFGDNSHHIICTDGSEEIQMPDGTVIKISFDGTETVEFPNGEKEIRAADYKRREYRDGTVKTVYESGRQETRYASGRIRIKDKDGNLVVDTKHFETYNAPVRLRAPQ